MAGRPRNYDREYVLKKAMELFWAKGFEGAHLGELVDTTGLNRFSLYKEFGSKDGLFREALERYYRIAQAVYDEHLTRTPLGLDNIRSYFSAIRFSPDYHGCFMINTLIEKDIVSDDVFETAMRFMKSAERVFLKNLNAAKSNGELSADENPRVLAKFLLTFDQGLAIYGITQPNSQDKNAMVEFMLERVLGDAHP